MLTQLATWLWCAMHAVEADNNTMSWISNMWTQCMLRTVVGQSGGQTNTVCPTNMYGACSTDGNNSFCILWILYMSCKTITTRVHIPAHTSSRAHITCTYTHTCTNTGMNKKLENNLFASLVFNIMTFYLIMLLQGTCCSREFTWHILVCRFSFFHYVPFYRHFWGVYY